MNTVALAQQAGQEAVDRVEHHEGGPSGAVRQESAQEQMDANDRQTRANTQDIAEQARMTGTQDFILKILGIISALLTPIIAGALLYLATKQKTDSENRRVEQREDLILVARSVNGVKTELVARAELSAFMEAVQIAADGKMTRNAEIRLAELQASVRHSAKLADEKAQAAIDELLLKNGGKSSPGHVVTLKTGEHQMMEGVDFGMPTEDPEAIGIQNGEVTSVVGKP